MSSESWAFFILNMQRKHAMKHHGGKKPCAERGSNENGNRILRRSVHKSMDIGKLAVKELQCIEDWVNNYPRKIFGYKSANEMID
jgi:IS30 family transposase